MQTISLGAPPKPASGDGDVVLSLEGREFIFMWKDGEYKGVRSGTHAVLGFAQTQTNGSDNTGITACECCVYDPAGGPRICWSIRCGTSCP
jgi:hypothetical protein